MLDELGLLGDRAARAAQVGAAVVDTIRRPADCQLFLLLKACKYRCSIKSDSARLHDKQAAILSLSIHLQGHGHPCCLKVILHPNGTSSPNCNEIESISRGYAAGAFFYWLLYRQIAHPPTINVLLFRRTCCSSPASGPHLIQQATGHHYT